MCLTTIDKRKKLKQIEKDKDGNFIAYKVVWLYRDMKRTMICPLMFGATRNPLRFNEWLDEVEYRALSVGDTISSCLEEFSYSTGWHSFVYERDAIEYSQERLSPNTVIKVKVKNIIATGTQEGRPTIVSKYIRINEYA